MSHESQDINGYWRKNKYAQFCLRGSIKLNFDFYDLCTIYFNRYVSNYNRPI